MLGRRKSSAPATDQARVRPGADAAAPDLGYVFVVTYGRSGSTLLSGILNSIPGYLIRGENSGALRHLFEFHRTMAQESERAGKQLLRQRTHPYFGIGDFPAARSIDGIRRLVLDTVLRPRTETRVTGFKEIRWDHADLAEYVAWLGEVFPGARFVINTRAHEDVLKSKWWAEGDKSARLAEVESRILALAEELGEAAFRVHYDDYVAEPETLRGLFEWLVEEFDATRVREVMEKPHSV